MIGLEYIRKLYGDTTIELGEKLKISNVNVSQWETQKKPIPEKRLEELSKLYDDVPPKYFSKELTRLEQLKVNYNKANKEYAKTVVEYEEPIAFDSNGIPTEFATLKLGDDGLAEYLRDIEADIKIEKTIQEVRDIIGNSYDDHKNSDDFNIDDYINSKEIDLELIHKFVSLMKTNTSLFLGRVLRAIELSEPHGEDWGTNPYTDNTLVDSLCKVIREWRISEEERRKKEYQEYKDLFGLED